MATEINPKNLKRLCMRRELTVTELAMVIGVCRPSVYRAVREPHRHQPTYTKITHVLCPAVQN